MPARAPLTPREVERLKTFWARTGVAARLLHSRLAMPLTYPLNAASQEHLNPSQQSPMALKRDEAAKCISHIKPIVTGMSQVASVLRGLQSISHYKGSSKERMLHVDKPETRMDYLRAQNLRRTCRQTKIGIGTGWEEWGSGRPADDVKRRFTVDL